jgi:hypothetical protein
MDFYKYVMCHRMYCTMFNVKQEALCLPSTLPKAGVDSVRSLSR